MASGDARRTHCARSDDDQDTRFCAECLLKPCRWFSGWRPTYGSEQYAQGTAEAEAMAACSNDPSNKTQDHFKSRRVLFQEVDRLIRGRVREVLPGVTLEFKQQIDKDLGLDALRDRVRRVTDGITKDIEAISGRASIVAENRMDLLFTRLEQEVADTILDMFAKKAGAIVAKEVGSQLARILAQPLKRTTKEYRVRVKKKRKDAR